MNHRPLPHRSSRRILATSILGLLAGLGATSTQAATGTWTNLAGGSWVTATNWSGSIIGDGVDSIADFSTLNITANATVTLDAARTIGQLKFGDATSATNDWILNTGTAGPLTMDVTTGQAIINVTTGRTATIGAVLAGSDGINVTSATTGAVGGNLILGAANTFTGGLTITGGIVQLNNATAAGANVITVAATANNTIANKLAINGGLTIANNIIINGASPLAGNGAVQQVGTGQSTVNGTINITANTANGGHFVGGTATGNELVLNGVITSSAPGGVVQRDGRVILKGGGTGYTSWTITGTTIIGANNGMATTAGVVIGSSAAGTLDLGTFNQAVASLNFAGGGVGTLTSTTGSLTLNGTVTSSGNFTHLYNGLTNLNGAARTFTINDGTNEVDMQAGGSFSNGTITKQGPGTLALTGISSATLALTAGTLGGTGTMGTINVNTGTILAPATSQTSGTLTAGTLAFGTGAATVRMKIGAGGDLINSTTLTTDIAGTTTFSLNQLGGALVPGTYPLINYTGTSPGLTRFALAPLGHATVSLIDTGTSIAAQISGNDHIIWDGTNSSAWATGATGNWKLESTSAAADFITGDEVIFQDSPLNNTVTIAANVTPSKVTFTNTAATAYTVTGAGGFVGTTALSKTGNGILTLGSANNYSGATTIAAGTLVADYSTGNPLGTVSAISLASGTTLKLTHSGGAFNVVNPISGSGTVIIDPSTTTAGARDIATVTWNTTGFTGTLNLKPTLGSMRFTADVAGDIGSGPLIVDNGGQLFVSAANVTFPNNMTLAGTGFVEAAGTLGAIRSNTDTYTGVITINGSAKIGALGGTATFTNTLTGGTLTFGGSINNAGSETLALTGDASTLAGLIVNDASGTSNAANIIFSVGNGGTTGTIGSIPVTLKGDGFKTAAIRFDRSNGYTLLQPITSTSPTAVNDVRTQVQVDTLGTGFDTNGQTINLGSSSSATPSGSFRVGNVRAGALANVATSITGGGVLVSAGAANATLNLNSGANVAVNSVTVGAGGTGGVLNINPGATLAITSNLHLGENANNSATVNQTGGIVTVGTQLRVGHFATNTSNYNMSGGSVTVTPLIGSAFPYSTAVAEVNGGIYLGIDGTGNLTHSAGTVSTGFMVLDNRGETAAGANMVSGIDTYTLSGTGTLVFTNSFGFITRNATTAILLNGGTIQAGAGISPNFDTAKINVGGSVALDTNGANTFTLYGPMAGTGTLNLTGGGTFRTLDSTGATTTVVGGTGTGIGGSLGAVAFNIGATSTLQANRTGIDNWTGAISGSGTLSKLGSGTLALTGSGSGFTGTANVSLGRLNVPDNFAASAITVADGAALGGESSNASVTLGAATGSSLFINGTSAGALTATNLVLNGTTTVDFSTAPASTASPITVLNYTGVTGGLNFTLANAATYRGASFDTSTSGTVKLSLTTKALTWTGANGAAWDLNITQNWNDSVPAPETFFAGDTVTFADGPAQVAVSIGNGMAPFKTSVTSNTNNYTFTSAGNGISGSGNLEKSGNSTLTLVGANSYGGQTIVSGGTLVIPGATSLGNGTATNSIALSGGAKITYNAATAVDFGVNRGLAVGTGGGTLSHSNATAAGLTVSGNVTGSGNLTLNTALAGAGTFIFTGDNSGYTGNLSLTSSSTGIGVVRFATPSAVPLTGSLTVNFAPSGATGSAPALDIPTGITLPSGFGLNFTSLLSGTNSLRSQITSGGAATVNGPITLGGDNIIQFNPGSGVLTLNGPVNAGGGGFTGTFFLRGAGNGVVNGIVNIPNGQVSKTDAATWTINSTGNVWAGTNIFATGGIKLGITNALPITAPLTIGQASDASASTLDLNGFNQEVPNLIYVAGTGNTTRGVTNTAASLSVLTVNNPGTVTYGASTGVTGGILAGNLQLVKNNAGILTLGGTNTFTGGTLLNSGTIKFGGATSPLGANTSTLTVANGATIDAAGQNVTGRTSVVNVQGAGVGGLGAIQNTGAAITNTNFWTSLVLTGDTTIGTNTRYDLAGSAVNGGTFTLTKVGTGETWWSPAAGASIGNIVVNAGTFGVQTSSNLGSNLFSIIVNPAGQIQTFSAITNDKPITLNSGQLAANNNTSTWTNSITLSGAGTTNKIGTVTAGVGVVLNGQVTGNGFEKIGTGLLTLGSATNNYTGDTKVTAGTLNVAGAGRLSPSSFLDMNGGTVDTVGTAQTIAGLKGATGTVTSVGPAILSDVQATDSSFGGSLSGAIALTKSGNGVLTLTGLSSTTGNTLLSGGGLAVLGNLSNSAVAVAGGTLSGTGTTGPVALTGGTFAPGAPTGALNTTGVNFGGGTFAVQIAGPSAYSSVNVTGNVAFSASTALTLDFSTYDPVDYVDSFTIVLNDNAESILFSGGAFKFGSTALGDGDTFTAVSGANSQLFQITYAGNDGNEVILNAIPEPGSVLLLLGGFSALIGLQRFRRRS